MRSEIIALPIFTVKDPDDAYGVNDIDYIPRKDVLAIIDAALASRAAPPAAPVKGTVTQALRGLLAVVQDARQDEDVDCSTQAGGYLCGDVMSEAIEAALRALAGGRNGDECKRRTE